MLEISIKGLEQLSGLPIDWEDWDKDSRATIGQTVYAKFIDNPPIAENAVEETRNKEIYHMLVKATHKGVASHILEATVDQSGNEAWKALQKWFGSDEVCRTIVDFYRTKLEECRLDEDNSASSYINTFLQLQCSNKLEKHGEGYTALTKKEKFLAQISDLDYDVVKQNLSGDSIKTFIECVQRVREREQTLDKEATHNASKRARRGREYVSKETKPIPSIPSSILYKIEPRSVRINLIKWRTLWNTEGREIRPDELNTNGGGYSNNKKMSCEGGVKSGSDEKGHNTKQQGKEKSWARIPRCLEP